MGTIDEGLIKDIATEFYYHWHNSAGTNSCWWLNAVPVSEGLKHHLDKLGIGS